MTDYSQNGESKVLKELFEKLGITGGSYVDIGAGDGYEFSNTAYFRQSGWMGIEVDADPKGSIFVKRMKVTEKNVHEICKPCNLLSIDIDGNDYWILRRCLEMIEPDVIICEINSQLPLNQVSVMPYDENHQWDGTNYFGMSYLSAINLLEDFSYRVYTVVTSQNVIAVHKRHPVLPLKFSLHQTWSHPDTTKPFQLI